MQQKQIKSVFNTDVLVIGAGLSGLTAALSSAELGAKTILIEKGENASARGMTIGAVNSRIQKSAGVKINKKEVINELMRWSGFHADQRLISLWVEKSGAAVDWLETIILKTGEIPFFKKSNYLRKEKRSGFFYYPTATLSLTSRMKGIIAILENTAKNQRVDILYNMAAQQLLQNEVGKITGALIQSNSGELFQIHAHKAVILCTGDYGNNPKMLKEYIPKALNLIKSPYDLKNNVGDGHRMGLEIGAGMDPIPHCPMLFDEGLVDSPLSLPLARQPFLYVNTQGKRYVNEDLPFGYICNADLQQPGREKWVIWDSKWSNEVQNFKSIECKNLLEPIHNMSNVDILIKNNVIKMAYSIEELSKKISINYDVLKRTIDRYNQLSILGKDLDFNKRKECLTTIEKAPFYAVKTGPILMVTLGGLRVNTNLQVLDVNGDVINGLYASGNASGGFFAYDYPITFPGLSHGRALTFGRIAGLHAAGKR